MSFAFDAETARGLVIRCRKDWDPDETDGPIARARHPLNLGDRKIARILLRTLMDDDAGPQDLPAAFEREAPPAVHAGAPAHEGYQAAREAFDGRAAQVTARLKPRDGAP